MCVSWSVDITVSQILGTDLYSESLLKRMSLVMGKPVFALCEQKDADQAAHPRSLISIFVIRCLDSLTPLVSISEISSIYLASVAAQVGLSLTWPETPKTGFLVTRLICDLSHCRDSKIPYLLESTRALLEPVNTNLL